MKNLGIIALILSLIVICIGCSAQSNNETKDTEGKTSVSDSSEAGENSKKGDSTTLKHISGGEDFTVDIDEIEPDETTAKSNDNSSGKEKTTKKNSKDDGKEESSSTEQHTTPILPIP